MLAFALGMAFLLIYIWYRTELDCGGCPYRMACEPVEYSEDDLERME